MSNLIQAAHIWAPGPRVVPFIKGRVALYAILRAAGIGPGDEIVVPGYTCVVVAAAIGYTGARSVFYDINPDTYNGDPDLAAASVGPRTRAILVQHTYGMPADLGMLPDLCRDRGIMLVEDCAHAMGAVTSAGPVGQLGNASFVSFQWSKSVSTGLGGVARANDDDLAEAIHRLARDEFDEPSLLKSISLLTVSTLYEHLYRPTLFWTARDAYRWLGSRGLVTGSSSTGELQDPTMPPAYAERFGRRRLEQITRVLEQLPATVEHRMRIAQIYAEWCDQHGIRRQQGPQGAVSSHLRFPLLVSNRKHLLADARSQRIEIGDWFNAPLHPVEAAGEAFGYHLGTCPVADEYARRVINLPTHRHVTPDEAGRVLAFMDKHLASVIREPRQELNLDLANGGRV